MVCGICEQEIDRRGPTQKFCGPCSDARTRQRRRKWALQNPMPKERGAERIAAAAIRKKARQEIAASTRPDHAESLSWDAASSVDLSWLVRASVPLSYASSKNAVWRYARGHVFARRESASWKDALALKLKVALNGRRAVPNKVWLDIFVQKSNHRGDAVNVVDSVCDAVKTVLGVDDRWYSIRRLDWQIVKHEPMIYVGVGQESDAVVQACSVCGALLPLEHFASNKGNANGRSRECRGCRGILRRAEPNT